MVLGKRFLLRLFFVIEIFIFMTIYFLGTQGLHVVLSMRRGNAILALEIEHSEEELKELQKTIVSCEQNNFYKEKIAREHLYMARPNDEIYFLN